MKVSISNKKQTDRILNLDLESIIVKLMDEEDGEEWTLQQSILAEKWYKRFLILNLLCLCYTMKNM